jgi:hypothetical protein
LTQADKIFEKRVKTYSLEILKQKRVLTLKTGVFHRFRTLELKNKRKKRRFLRFSNEREWLTIAVPV